MEIKGKLAKKFDVATGVGKGGKQWNKVEFLIDKMGKYPSSVLVMSFDATVIEFIGDTKIGTDLACTVDVESREYNGRYYTDVKCFRVETYRQEQGSFLAEPKSNPPVENFQTPEVDDSLPF